MSANIIIASIVVPVLIVSGFLFAQSNSGKKTWSLQTAGPALGSDFGTSNPQNTNIILTVNDIQGDPLSFQGEIRIDGVMAGILPSDPQTFALVNTAEVRACKSIGCATFYLPIKYAGKLPGIGYEVVVTGTFAGGTEPLFLAKELKILGSVIARK